MDEIINLINCGVPLQLSSMEENANLSTFRRGNKIIAVGFTLLIVSIALLILITLTAVHINPPYPSIFESRTFTTPVETFCSYSDSLACITAVDSIVTDRSAIEPKEIADLCIQTAATALHNLINASSIHTLKFTSADCADSLSRASDRIRESLAATIRAKRPFLGWLSKDRDEAVIQPLTAAKEEVDYCLRNLAEVEPPPETVGKLEYVAVYLHSANRFLIWSRRMELMVKISSSFYTGIINNTFGAIVCGVQLFMLGFLCIFFRNRSRRVSLAQFIRSFSDNTAV